VIGDAHSHAVKYPVVETYPRQMGDHWRRWHQAYEDTANPLNDRRRHVVDAIAHFLDTAPPGPLIVVSLCAGDATDLAIAVGGHARCGDVVGAAIELDPELAQRAAANLASAGVPLDVRCADAGDIQSFSDLAPADLLMLVGIFGNVSDADIEHTVGAVAALCRPGATIIWTRHRRPPDLTPSIRRWFRECGCTNLRFDAPDDATWTVGTERLDSAPRAASLATERLFTFLPVD
jgi:hypothetical protein